MRGDEYIRVPCPRMLLVPGDIHFPLQDDKALTVMTMAAEGTALALGLQRGDIEICHTGDSFNSAGFSPHPNVRRHVAAKTEGTVEHEIREARPWIDTWHGLFGTQRLIAGNHEAWQATSLALDGSSWADTYGTLLVNCKTYPEGTKLRYGNLTLAHGHDLRGSLRMRAAASVLAEYPGQNTIFGHNHRLQQDTTPTTMNGKLVVQGAWSVGMLADRTKERRDRNMRAICDRHQQGFGLVYFTTHGLKVELCEIYQKRSRYWTVAAGREYSC